MIHALMNPRPPEANHESGMAALKDFPTSLGSSLVADQVGCCTGRCPVKSAAFLYTIAS